MGEGSARDPHQIGGNVGSPVDDVQVIPQAFVDRPAQNIKTFNPLRIGYQESVDILRNVRSAT